MKKRNPPNPGTPLSLRKRLGRNPDVRAFLEARFREAWTGSDFEIGTIVLVLEAVGQQFGPERAPSRTTVYDYAGRMRKRLTQESDSVDRGEAARAAALLAEIVKSAEQLVTLIEQASVVLAECLQRPRDHPVQPDPKNWQH